MNYTDCIGIHRIVYAKHINDYFVAFRIYEFYKSFKHDAPPTSTNSGHIFTDVVRDTLNLTYAKAQKLWVAPTYIFRLPRK